MSVCIYYIHTYIHYTYIHTYIPVHVHVCVYIYVYIHIHVVPCLKIQHKDFACRARALDVVTQSMAVI